MSIPFVGKRFTPEAFKEYIKTINFTNFKPEFVTMHHTAAPSLAQRLTGFSEQHLQNLLHYYQETLGWNGAPHIFIDDRSDGIIVFQRLDKRGVHAVSFNHNSWGLEMLGNFDSHSEFYSARGQKIFHLACECIAIMDEKIGVAAKTLRFHRDDPKTSKTCPGLAIQDKSEAIELISEYLHSSDESEPVAASWKVYFEGSEYIPVLELDGRPIIQARSFINKYYPSTQVTLSSDHKSLTLKYKTEGTVMSVADLDANGSAWVFLRDLSNFFKIGLHIDSSKKLIKLTRSI